MCRLACLLPTLSLIHSTEGEAHKIELSKLAEKDPEFFKYLQDNDQELLEFDPSTQQDDDVMEYDDEFAKLKQRPVLTKEELKQWQKAILEVCPLNFYVELKGF